MKTTKAILLSLLLLSQCALTGCFDNIELENRNFVLTLGIDEYSPADGGSPDNNFTITMSIPNIIKKGANEKIIKTASGKTISDAINSVNSYSGNIIDFRQAKVIVIGKDLLENKKLLSESMDVLERNKQLSSKTILLGCDVRASTILNAKMNENMLFGNYVIDFFSNNTNNISASFTKDLMTILQNTSEGSTTIIPKVELKSGHEVLINSGMVIKQLQFVTNVDKDISVGYAYILGKGNGNTLYTSYDSDNVSMKIGSVKGKIKFVEKNEALYMENTLDVVGGVNEYTFGEKNILEKDKIIQLESQYKKNIESKAMQSWKFFQDKDIDAFQIVDRLKKSNYELYLKYAKDKPDIMKTINYEVNANVQIDSVGSVK